MHWRTKVVNLLVLFNGIGCTITTTEYTLPPEPVPMDKANCDDNGREKVGRAKVCLNDAIGKLNYTKREKTCCDVYYKHCMTAKVVSNTCVCETITADIPLTDRYRSTAVLTPSGKR